MLIGLEMVSAETNNINLTALEESLNAIQARISDCDTEDILKFLEDVAQLQQFARDLNSCQLRREGQNENGLLGRVHVILQNSMIRLEDDFVGLLMRHGQPTEPNFMSFRSESSLPDDFSVNSFGEELVQERMVREESFNSEEYLIDMISADVLPDIKQVARVMFLSDYDLECCQSYITARKDALDELLSFLHVEKLTIEEVSRMKWGILSWKIGRWIKVIKVFVRVYLASEKRLCSLIFGDLSKSASRDCFCESAKGSMMQLLNFAEAVALGNPAVEKLFRILDVYDTLVDLLPDIDSLNLKDSGFCVMTECQEILSRLSNCGRGIFLMLTDHIRNDSSSPPGHGGIHPLTQYVMNYVLLMASYEKPISLIFGSPSALFDGMMEDKRSCDAFSLAEYIVSIMSILESNLDSKSSVYPSPPLQHLFMVNNLHYMVRKVRDNSDLEQFLGEIWLKTQIGKCRRHATLYERTSWSPVLSILVDEDPYLRTRRIKDKFKGFNHAFEELYKVQTAWLIPDKHLREDLRLSITQKLVLAYRMFIGKDGSSQDGHHRRGKYIKYSPEDIHNSLWDLFEGSPKSLSSYL